VSLIFRAARSDQCIKIKGQGNELGVGVLLREMVYEMVKGINTTATVEMNRKRYACEQMESAWYDRGSADEN